MVPIILFSVMTLGVVAAGAAMILFFVAQKFKVVEDPRIDEVTDLLPGANCGGCGFPGCRGFAEAIVKAADEGDISSLNCPAGGSVTMTAVGEFLGFEVSGAEPTIAVVRCGGTREKAPAKLTYDGPARCLISHKLFSGENGCPYGCMGLGDCVASCQFDAIHMDPATGLPVVDREKCVSCGACVKACPRGIIEIRPRGKKKERRVWVSCMNREKGAVARKNCSAACIGCMRCVKECPVDAITVADFLAYIDPEKCIACGKCIPVCPTAAIQATFEPPKPKPKPEKKAQADSGKDRESADA